MTLQTTSRPPAEIYDEKFVPALFAQWGPVMVEAAHILPADRVLDVACGTGALTLAAAEKVGADGHVTGLDINPEMLAIARARTAEIEWREGAAESLPFGDGSFDAVVSQFGLMFFADRAKALREMMRVLRPGGGLAVAVCGAVERSPGYAAFAATLDRLFGREIGDAFRAPFVLGESARFEAIAKEAGLDGARIDERVGVVRFASIDDLVATEGACVWTLGGILDAGQLEILLREARTVLQPFTDGAGAVSFDMPALIFMARKPAV